MNRIVGFGRFREFVGIKKNIWAQKKKIEHLHDNCVTPPAVNDPIIRFKKKKYRVILVVKLFLSKKME